MSSEAIATVVKMMGTLPDTTRNQAVEYLQTYIADLHDEQRWNETYAKTQTNLVQKARLAKQQIVVDKARPLNIDEL